MQEVLLDTHTFIWFIEGNPKLSVAAKTIIYDPAIQKRLSIASAWEMSIKSGLGRLSLGQPLSSLLPAQIAGNGFVLLPIELHHLPLVETLPLHHRDPFDRLLIAQSIVEGMPLVSADAAFDAYTSSGLTRLW